MAERKAKRESESLTEMDSEESGFVLKPTQVEVGSGYTLSVKYDENENPVINVKTYGEVDVTKLKKEIERAFPNAQIQQLDQPQPVIVTRKHKKRKLKKK
jgi:hypothetical protein